LAKAKLDINHKTKNGQVHANVITESKKASKPSNGTKQPKSMLSRIPHKRQPIKIKSKRKVRRTR